VEEKEEEGEQKGRQGGGLETWKGDPTMNMIEFALIQY